MNIHFVGVRVDVIFSSMRSLKPKIFPIQFGTFLQQLKHKKMTTNLYGSYWSQNYSITEGTHLMQDFPLNYAVFYHMCIHHTRMHMRIVRHNENVSNYLRHQSQYICCFQIIYSRKTTYRQHAQFDSKQKKMVTRQAEYEIIS